MNRKLKKAIAGILAVSMVCASSSVPSDIHIGDIIGFGIEASAETTEIVASGECGDNLTWTLDNEGTLIVSGTGKMNAYGSFGSGYAANLGAWREKKSYIKTVIIEDGVENISKQAFANCSQLTSITIPDSVTSIETKVFYACDRLKSIAIPNRVTSIDNSAFLDCYLNHIHIPSDKDISDYCGKYSLPKDESCYFHLDANGMCPEANCPLDKAIGHRSGSGQIYFVLHLHGFCS